MKIIVSCPDCRRRVAKVDQSPIEQVVPPLVWNALAEEIIKGGAVHQKDPEVIFRSLDQQPGRGLFIFDTTCTSVR